MGSTDKSSDQPPTDKQPKTGKAQGGADSSGPGNILGGVQPDHDAGDESERRDTSDAT